MVSMKISAGFRIKCCKKEIAFFLVAGSALMVIARLRKLRRKSPGRFRKDQPDSGNAANEQPAAQPQTQDTAERAAVQGSGRRVWA